MGLGELHHPKGLALEQAQQVLELKNPHAVNVALGCRGGCTYCYGPRASFRGGKWGDVRLPKTPPISLVKKQLDGGLLIEGVFISFLTDPYLPEVRSNTEGLISYLTEQGIRTATSSKIDVSNQLENRSGMTIISPYKEFSVEYEPNVMSPQKRIAVLKGVSDRGQYTWVSLEPCPVKAIYPYKMKDLHDFWESLKFVDFIIMGKWNYDRRASTEEAREEYSMIIGEFEDFCENNKIRFHIKSDTLKFIGR